MIWNPAFVHRNHESMGPSRFQDFGAPLSGLCCGNAVDLSGYVEGHCRKVWTAKSYGLEMLASQTKKTPRRLIAHAILCKRV